MELKGILLSLLKPVITGGLFFCCSLSEAVPFSRKETIMVKTDPQPAQQVIIQFLKWYKANLNKANNFPILIKDSTGNFMVNKAASTAYLNFLKSSRCISQKYIDHWKIYFDDKAIELKDHPLQSDVPEGFDFDFVLITQEPELVLNQIGRIKFKTISVSASVALIGLKWPGKDSMEYEFEMYKTKAGWQIGYISTPNFD